MYKFTRHTKSNENTQVVIYTPVHASNITSYAHIKATYVSEPKEGEEPETKLVEYLAIQTNIIAEQARAVPLKVLKRVGQKQDKSNHEQYFLTEEVAKVMEPIIERIDNKEEIEKIVKFLEENSI